MQSPRVCCFVRSPSGPLTSRGGTAMGGGHSSLEASGAGRPAPRSVVMPEFMFATGIENSYPTIGLSDGTTYRVDEMAKTGHYERWREDFQLVNEMGIEHLRYGP